MVTVRLKARSKASDIQGIVHVRLRRRDYCRGDLVTHVGPRSGSRDLSPLPSLSAPWSSTATPSSYKSERLRSPAQQRRRASVVTLQRITAENHTPYRTRSAIGRDKHWAHRAVRYYNYYYLTNPPFPEKIAYMSRTMQCNKILYNY